MLARNAEALYWIGRYVERADDTRAHSRRRGAIARGFQCRSRPARLLLRVLGIDRPTTGWMSGP